MQTKKFGTGHVSVQSVLLSLGIGGIFTMLAAKVAFVRQFPLPYDESFHVGLIKLYSHHLNPFLMHQPQGADVFGAVARDPSYLYHYLMSFPYRLIAALIPGEVGEVIALRSINIALALGTLYLVYRLARRCGLPHVGASLVSLGLAVTPVFYDLAAQVNYDNLLIPLTLISLLLTMRVAEQLRSKRLPVQSLSLLIGVVLLTSLVKYSYLPIALALAFYLMVVAYKTIRPRGFIRNFGQTFVSLPRFKRLALVVLVIVSSVLWAQRYGVNLVQYHTLHPQCNAVMSIADCSQYGPWARNYALHTDRATRMLPAHILPSFTKFWVKTVSKELYAIVQAHPGYISYASVASTTVVAAAAITIAGLSIVFFSKEFHQKLPVLSLFSLVAGLYLAMLFMQNFAE